MKIEFFIAGIPAPGGSKSGFPFKRADGSLGVRMVDAGKGNAAWKKLAALIAKSNMNRLRLQPLDGPIRFSAEFVMPRGKTVTRAMHTVAPDVCKLTRALEDAMTDIVWVDDAQVVEHVRMHKRYARAGEQTGAMVTVEAISEQTVMTLTSSSKSSPSPPAPKPAPPPDTDSPFD